MYGDLVHIAVPVKSRYVAPLPRDNTIDHPNRKSLFIVSHFKNSYANQQRFFQRQIWRAAIFL